MLGGWPLLVRVLVVGSDVADGGVQTDAVVLDAHPLQLDGEDLGIGDGLQVRPLALDVAEEALYGRLIGGHGGAAEVLGDGAQGHERLVTSAVMGAPLSETANRMGSWPSDGSSPASRRSSTESMSPSASRNKCDDMARTELG